MPLNSLSQIRFYKTDIASTRSEAEVSFMGEVCILRRILSLHLLCNNKLLAKGYSKREKLVPRLQNGSLRNCLSVLGRKIQRSHWNKFCSFNICRLTIHLKDTCSTAEELKTALRAIGNILETDEGTMTGRWSTQNVARWSPYISGIWS